MMTEGESERWYARNYIARELEILADKLLRSKAQAAWIVGNIVLDHVDKMRGELGAQADQEARDLMRERERQGEWIGPPR